MIDIRTIRPVSAECGLPTAIEIEVNWAGPDNRTISVHVVVTGQCTFNGSNDAGSAAETGEAPLWFIFPGSFSCPPGKDYTTQLAVTAHDKATGEDDQRAQLIEIAC